jgi:hypothetical protein
MAIVERLLGNKVAWKEVSASTVKEKRRRKRRTLGFRLSKEPSRKPMVWPQRKFSMVPTRLVHWQYY